MCYNIITEGKENPTNQKGIKVMNKKERIAMVRAMETVCRNLNDEAGIECWFVNGVADGDITEETTDEELEYYVEDDVFADLMDTFAYVMTKYAKRKSSEDGGQFYCDHVCSHYVG